MTRAAGARPWQSGAAALLSSLLTFAVFFTVRGNGFVDFDDLGYIASYQSLRKLDLQTLLWKLVESPEANWHPLTLLSLAVEHQLWGRGMPVAAATRSPACQEGAARRWPLPAPMCCTIQDESRRL